MYYILLNFVKHQYPDHVKRAASNGGQILAPFAATAKFLREKLPPAAKHFLAKIITLQ